MEGAEGAQSRNRLICCQTTNTTFDVVWFLLSEVVSLTVVADYSGSNYILGYSSCVLLQNITHPFLETEHYIYGSM